MIYYTLYQNTPKHQAHLRENRANRISFRIIREMVDQSETWENPSRSVDFLICGRSQVRKPVATIGSPR